MTHNWEYVDCLRKPVTSLGWRTPVIVPATTTDSFPEVRARMIENNVGCVMGVDESGKPVWLSTERNHVEWLAAKTEFLEGRRASCSDLITDWAVRDLRVCFETDCVGGAMQDMTLTYIRRLPMLNEDGQLVGYISTRDILRYLESCADQWSEHPQLKRVARYFGREKEKVRRIREDGRITVGQLCCTLRDEGIGSVVVVRDGDQPTGIITEYDALKLPPDLTVLNAPATTLMQRELVVVYTNTSLREIVSLMSRRHFRHLVVVHRRTGKLLRILSVRDVLDWFAEQADSQAMEWIEAHPEEIE